jgi:uncharacterized protein YqgV (UPF0045/DUF77 family)
MNATELTSEISTLRASLSALEAARSEFIGRRDQALVVEPRRFSQHAVDAARREIARVEREIVNSQERIAALERQLPSAEEILAATSEARAVSEQAQAAFAALEAAWSQFMAQIEAAEAAARAVAAKRVQAQVAIWTARDLSDRFALRVEVPAMPDVDRIETQIAGLIGLVIRDVGYTQVIDDLADRELSAARARSLWRSCMEPPEFCVETMVAPTRKRLVWAGGRVG